jgi:hypothetical protein
VIVCLKYPGGVLLRCCAAALLCCCAAVLLRCLAAWLVGWLPEMSAYLVGSEFSLNFFDN